MVSAGLVSVGAYVPAKRLSPSTAERLAGFLARHSLLPGDYVEPIRNEQTLPGSVETNYDGWEKHPWFDAWRKSLPPKKQAEPFLGTKERRRVPLDPVSVRESLHPHPMLSTHAEAIAGALALTRADIDPAAVDLVLVHSQMPDTLPSMAASVQHVLQLPNAGAYGIDSCCSTFVTMTELAAALVRSGVKKCVLLVGSHVASHVLDRSEYCCVRLGDGAVAGVVTAVEDGYGYVASHSTADGSVHDAVLMVRRPPSLMRSTLLGPDFSQNLVTFHNQEALKKIALESDAAMMKMAGGLLDRAGMKISDVDFFVTHQPVEWAGNAWREALGIAPERFHESYERYGNVGTCSCAINLEDALELGKIKAGDRVLLASSGAGENHIGLVERASPGLIQAMRNAA